MLPLRRLRENRGVTQAELSKTLRISPSTVGMWEQGRREPDYEMLKRLADYFNVSVDYLLGHETPKPLALSDEQVTVLSIFDSLDTDGRKLLMGMLNSLKMSHSVRENNSSSIEQNNRNRNNYFGVTGSNFSSNVATTR